MTLPLAAIATSKVFDLYEELKVLENVKEVAPYLESKLEQLAEKYDCIETRRGVGLMQGLVFSCPVGPVINKALEKGLILINAGEKVIRFIPPLIITKSHVDEMIEILTGCFDMKKEMDG